MFNTQYCPAAERSASLARSDTKRTRARWSLQLAAVCGIAFISGCSVLGSPTVENCSTNAECREAVGFGSVCTEDNLCSSTVSQNARCTKTSPRDLFLNPERYGDAIIVGTIFDDSQAKHLFRENSVELAAHELNGLGADKLEGRQIGLVQCTPSPDDRLDDLSQSEGAAAAARYLTDVIGVSTVIGPADSTSAKAVYEELTGSGTLVMSPSATSTALSDIDPDGLLWRTAPPDDLQAVAIATYLSRPPVGEDTGSGDVYVIYAEDDYGRPLFENFQQVFTGKLLGSSGFSPEDSRPLTDAIRLASKSPAQTILFLANQSNVENFLKDVLQRPNDYLKSPVKREIFLPDTAAASDVSENVAGLSDLFHMIRGTRPVLKEDSVAYEHFRGEYIKRFGESPDGRSYSSNSYDAAWLVFAGMEWSQGNYGEITGEGIVGGLRQVSNGDLAETELSPLEWKNIGGLLRKGQSINVTGASGALDYIDYEGGIDELGKHHYEIWEYIGTKVQPNEDATDYLRSKLYDEQ